MASHRVTRTCKRCAKTFQQRADRKGIYCSNACYRAPTVEDRFWAKVRKTDSCWLWTAGTDRDGYGEFWVSETERAVKAHRYSWELHYGPIPKDQQVLHRCDVRPCIKPTDLFLGTNLDNADDMYQKGRNPQGETHGMAIVNEAKVREIRERYKRGGISQIALGLQYGLTQTAVSHIVLHKCWKLIK